MAKEKKKTLAPQVLADWHHRYDSETVEMCAWKLAMHDFLREPGAGITLKGNEKHVDGKANLACMLALDNTFQSLDFSLDKYLCQRIPLPLSETDRQYFADATHLPPFLGTDLGFKRRSCVQDTVTGETHLEVAWSQDRRLLVETSDRGAVGYCFKFFLYGPGGCRGTVN